MLRLRSQIAIVAALILMLFSSPVSAHGTLDQSAGGSRCYGLVYAHFGPFLGQSFTPTLPQLAAIEVGVHFAGTEGEPLAPQVSLILRTFSPPNYDSGIVLGSSTIATPQLPNTGSTKGGGDGSYRVTYLHFDFASPILLTPGAKYVMQVQLPGRWFGWCVTEGKEYQGGNRIQSSRPGYYVGDDDFHFRTYGFVSATTTQFVSPTTTQPGLSTSQAPSTNFEVLGIPIWEVGLALAILVGILAVVLKAKATAGRGNDNTELSRRRLCGNCGQELPLEATFCNKCGTRNS